MLIYMLIFKTTLFAKDVDDSGSLLFQLHLCTWSINSLKNKSRKPQLRTWRSLNFFCLSLGSVCVSGGMP